MKDFYLTLASNSSMDYFDNKTSNFTVKLPKTLTLDGKWIVALAEIHYQNTFLNVSEGSNSITFRRRPKTDKFIELTDDTLEQCIIQTRNYNSIQDILNALNFYMNSFLNIFNFEKDETKLDEKQEEATTNTEKETTKQPEIKTDSKDDKLFTYFDRERKVVLINPDIKKMFSQLYFTNRLAIQLGYEPDTNALRKPKDLVRRPHLSYGIADEMMVYCDIIEPQVFGHEMAKIIRIVNIKKDALFGETCHKEYQRLQYIPLLKKEFETISIELRDKTGTVLPFLYGTVLLVLHFMKIE
jgi:cell fate (sporulation/competence/biofilm development) regulator YlbF (YheA/YmcA/DUF963 family)